MRNSGTVPCRDEGCVFLSHTGQDNEGKDLADRMYSELETTGKKKFFDARTLEWGEDESAMIKAVRTCGVFVAIITPTYTQRKWPLTELHEALESVRKVCPVCINISHEDLKMWAQGTRPHEAKQQFELGFDPAEDVKKLLKTNILYKQSDRNSKIWVGDLAKELVGKLLTQLGDHIAGTSGVPGAIDRPVCSQVCARDQALCVTIFSLCSYGIDGLWCLGMLMNCAAHESDMPVAVQLMSSQHCLPYRA
jgi:hypothetical protein